MDRVKSDKYLKRPEYVDVDNAKQGKEYSRIYRKDSTGSLGALNPPVAASRSGKMGGLPRHGLILGAKGDVTPIQTRNRTSPNPLEERQ